VRPIIKRNLSLKEETDGDPSSGRTG